MTVTDDSGALDDADTAVVTLTGSNDAPVVTGAVLATVDEDDSNPATVQLLANASDPDRTDDVDTASVSYAVTSGTWVPAVVYSVDNETGALTFDPNQFNALGVAESIELTFTYDVVDGNGGITPTTAVVTITGTNDAPVVTGAVLATVDEDDSNPATVNLLANASDPDRTDDVDTASVSYTVTSGTWVPAVVYSVDNEIRRADLRSEPVQRPRRGREHRADLHLQRRRRQWRRHADHGGGHHHRHQRCAGGDGRGAGHGRRGRQQPGDGQPAGQCQRSGPHRRRRHRQRRLHGDQRHLGAGGRLQRRQRDRRADLRSEPVQRPRREPRASS